MARFLQPTLFNTHTSKPFTASNRFSVGPLNENRETAVRNGKEKGRGMGEGRREEKARQDAKLRSPNTLGDREGILIARRCFMPP